MAVTQALATALLLLAACDDKSTNPDDTGTDSVDDVTDTASVDDVMDTASVDDWTDTDSVDDWTDTDSVDDWTDADSGDPVLDACVDDEICHDATDPVITCDEDDDCSGLTDAYCDVTSGVCTDKKTQGESCAAPGECLSGFCPAPDGVCCDVACDLLCESCLAAHTTATDDGSCAPVLVATDPDGDCPEAAPSDCGAAGTGCSGTAGACILKNSSFVCIAPTCDPTSNEQTTAGICDGDGTCDPGTTSTCDPYVCNPSSTACLTACGSSDDCNTDTYCDGDTNTCVPLLADGSSCTLPVTGEECQSGHCVEGLCCDASCSTSCESCVGSFTGGSDGDCLPISSGTDPRGDCPTGFCNGTGSCTACLSEPPPPGTGCPAPCTYCAAGVCTIDCTADGSCQSMTLDCPASFQCEILCGGTSSCEGTIIHCPETYACDISCEGPSGCRDVSINCSSMGSCDLYCGPGSEACLDVTQTCGGNECRAICNSVPPSEEPNTVCGGSCSCLQC